jgi:ABC-type uncharacterized transport system involved in gliding motility auxiliary subunit
VIFNALDYVCGRESMIRIRNRHLHKSRINVRSYMKQHNIVWGDLDIIENNIKLITKVIAIALAPLILIVTGLWLAYRRKLRLRLINEEI